MRAVDVLDLVVNVRARAVVRSGLVPELMSGVIFPLLCDTSIDDELEEDEGDDEDNVDNGRDVSKASFRLLSDMSLRVPNEVIFEPAMAAARSMDMSTAAGRKGALFIISALPEGCMDLMVGHVAECVPLIVAGLGDVTSARVRSIAAFCLYTFARLLTDEVVQHHLTVLPALFKTVEDRNAGVRCDALLALEEFSEHVGRRIIPFMEPIVQRMVALIREPGMLTKHKCMAVSTISAVVMSALDDFRPAADPTIQEMHRIITSPITAAAGSPELDMQLELKARAT